MNENMFTAEVAKRLGIPESALCAAMHLASKEVSARTDIPENILTGASFANAARIDSTHTYTENGAQALKTTSDARLDLFAVIGALRSADDNRLISLFENAYAVDPLFTTKILFYARDIRGGLGERETFRRLLKHIANRHPEALVENLDLIGFYGRWDDLYSLIGTPIEEEMWRAMRKQWNADISALKRGEAVSLLGKWVKTADASSKDTRKLGILTAQKLGLSVYDYKRQYRALRKHIGVVEQLMSQNRWDEIKYPEVPSRAMTLYRDAFKRHDEERFTGYLEKVTSGEGMSQRFTQNGYSLPTVVYWNVNSRHDVYHADADRPGCVLVSGHSASSFKQVLKCVNMTPIEAMEEIINSERYRPVTIGKPSSANRATFSD